MVESDERESKGRGRRTIGAFVGPRCCGGRGCVPAEERRPQRGAPGPRGGALLALLRARGRLCGRAGGRSTGRARCRCLCAAAALTRHVPTLTRQPRLRLCIEFDVRPEVSDEPWEAIREDDFFGGAKARGEEAAEAAAGAELCLGRGEEMRDGSGRSEAGPCVGAFGENTSGSREADATHRSRACR